VHAGDKTKCVSMSIFNIFFSCFVQGVTEAFPVSSSLHLDLFTMLNRSEIGVLHLGSGIAFALFLLRFSYFLFRNFWYVLMNIILMILPTILAGFFLKNYLISLQCCHHTVLLINLLCGAALCVLSVANHRRNMLSLKHYEAFIIGTIAALAFIPGVSRFGITFTALRVFGIRKLDSVILCLLTGIPITIGAGLVSIMKGTVIVSIQFTVLLSVLISIVTYCSLLILMRCIKRFYIFGIYRIVFSCIGFIK
jgi:undecaprenyl-diphosphatase